MGRCPAVTEVAASSTRGPAGVVPACSAAGCCRRPKPAAVSCCPVVLRPVSTAEAVVRLASPCRASSTPSTPCGPPSERASWGGRPCSTRRGRRADYPKVVSGESCRTPLMDDSKIAPPSTSAARVHSQCSIVPDRTGSLPKQAGSCSVQLLRRDAVGGASHDFIEHLRPGPAKPESCSVLAVSHDFDGLLRVRSAGLLHPAANHGVRLVSSLHPAHPAVRVRARPEGRVHRRTAVRFP